MAWEVLEDLFFWEDEEVEEDVLEKFAQSCMLTPDMSVEDTAAHVFAVYCTGAELSGKPIHPSSMVVVHKGSGRARVITGDTIEIIEQRKQEFTELCDEYMRCQGVILHPKFPMHVVQKEGL